MEKRHPFSHWYHRGESSSGFGVLIAVAVRYPWSRSSSKVRSRTSTPWSSPNRPHRVTCRVVDGAEEGVLLLAELDAPLSGGRGEHHDGKGVYRLSVSADIPV